MLAHETMDLIASDGAGGGDADDCAGSGVADDAGGDASEDTTRNPYSLNYVPDVATSTTMRDMVATFVYSLTVASVRKIAKQSAVNQSGATRAQLRGMLYSAAASAVPTVGTTPGVDWHNVLGDDCKTSYKSGESDAPLASVTFVKMLKEFLPPALRAGYRRRCHRAAELGEPDRQTICSVV
jgi:hypothetical protein